MPENGVTTSSSFENLIREYRGRPPTAKETQRILACNRLLTTTDFDPVTVFLTVFGEEFDRIAERVEAAGKGAGAVPADVLSALSRMEERQKEQTRVLESLSRRNGKPASDPIAESGRYAMAFCLALLVCVATAVIAAGREPTFPFVGWLGAFAIGILVTLAYQRLAPMIKRGR